MGNTSGTSAIAILGTLPVLVSRLWILLTRDRRDFEILKVGGRFSVRIQLTRNSESSVIRNYLQNNPNIGLNDFQMSPDPSRGTT